MSRVDSNNLLLLGFLEPQFQLSILQAFDVALIETNFAVEAFEHFTHVLKQGLMHVVPSLAHLVIFQKI